MRLFLYTIYVAEVLFICGASIPGVLCAFIKFVTELPMNFGSLGFNGPFNG